MLILFYGNCQTNAIKQILKFNPRFVKSIYIPCYETELSENNFTEIIKKCDIIITQPINDNYRDKHYLSTNYIVKNKKKECRLIIFDSCHFEFYYFDLTYKTYNGERIQSPSDYHYNYMIECFKNNKSINYYIENFVNNDKLKTSEELESIANKSLDELNRRYSDFMNKYKGDNIYTIPTSQYIRNNYKKKLLFYSMNHPTKYLLQFICEQILHILRFRNVIDYNIDPLNNPRCILYKCVQSSVNFNINNYIPLTNDETNIYKITEKYYNTYSKIRHCI